uniref:DUF659 domain-containing protein n=1 Tax=Chromera velia CCMP2878 TaxID=1169474 RepID=A0A0G4I0V6_9ALVE|eukprot:Cvel_10035.t1-p1 / transcript=Cvel_10035.t1 / gene=Cvel_10035 / organism=Chromera_velia_CCMP2878 / gene_product=hypothetical protein / transcript_product=hypothetical protein / location=Cvel_scaffold597:124-1557(-) / protein_length=361 / sequence_SO=supercontig / SO=protein_coding / is_pseudo=false
MLTTNFLASAGWPHLTENEALQKLVKALDPRYDLPSVGKVQRLLLPTLKNKIILSIKDRLRKAVTRRVSITLDMWLHSGKSGFLAIIIHWLTENFKMDSASFLDSETTIYHGAEQIGEMVRKVLNLLGISLEEVLAATSDRGGNVVNAVDHTEAKLNVSLFGKVMKRTTTHTTIRWLGFQNNLTYLLPLAQRNWVDKLVKVHEKQIIAYETDSWVRYPAFDRFATGDMLYDWDILDMNDKRLQHAPDPERRKTATIFPVGVEQFQKGKGKGNGGAADSAGEGAAPAGPDGRTNLKPKEAAADANAEKAGGKLPLPEKVITPGEEGYRPLYIHLQHKGLVVGPGAAQRVAELTNSGCLAAQK